MKIINYYIAIIVSALIFNGCVDDSGSNPEFGDKDIPRIYINWQANMAYKLGQTVVLEPIVSPSDGATYNWTLNGETISTGKDLNYQLNDFLIDAELKFEVTRNGVSNHRVASLLVTKDFEPKANKLKSFGYLTANGTVGDVDWQNITHLIITSVVVNDDGSLDTSLLQDLDMELITTFAHHYGVYVLLEMSGVITYLNAMSAYDSRTFYNAAVNNADLLVANMQALVFANGLDGVSIYMDKPISENYDDPEALKVFYEKIGTAFKSEVNLIDGQEYPYVMSLSLFGGWTRGAMVGMVNIPQFDYIQMLAFSFEDLAPGPHSSPDQAATEIATWLSWLGPINDSKKIILVAPAFGLRYFGTPADYTWGNLWQYTEYLGYRYLCATYPDVPSNNVIVITENGGDPNVAVNKIFYNGFADIDGKIGLVTNYNLGGMGLWSLENDSRSPSESLIRKIRESLDNLE